MKEVADTLLTTGDRRIDRAIATAIDPPHSAMDANLSVSGPLSEEDNTCPPTTDVYLAIFDHDGVLVDSLEFHTQAWFELGRRAGLKFTAGVHPRDLRHDQPEHLPQLLGDKVGR